MKFCPKCQIDVREDAKFCPNCGGALVEKETTKFCGHCGAKVTAEMKCCPQCGASLVPGFNTSRQGPPKPPPRPTSPPPHPSTQATYAPAVGNGIVLLSSAPLPKKTGNSFMYAYLAVLAVSVLADLGTDLLVTLFSAHVITTAYFNFSLRSLKFKFVSWSTPDDIFNRLNPVLQRQSYNRAEFDRAGNTLSVKYNGATYDIAVNHDNTFSLRWRKSGAGLVLFILFFGLLQFTNYHKNRANMGLIAYELQKAYGVTK